MFNRLTRTLVKVVVASLIVGTILAHFGITAERVADMARSLIATPALATPAHKPERD